MDGSHLTTGNTKRATTYNFKTRETFAHKIQQHDAPDGPNMQPASTRFINQIGYLLVLHLLCSLLHDTELGNWLSMDTAVFSIDRSGQAACCSWS